MSLITFLKYWMIFHLRISSFARPILCQARLLKSTGGFLRLNTLFSLWDGGIDRFPWKSGQKVKIPSQNKTCSFLVDWSSLLKTWRPGIWCLLHLQCLKNLSILPSSIGMSNRLNQDLMECSKKVHATSKLWSICLLFFLYICQMCHSKVWQYIQMWVALCIFILFNAMHLQIYLDASKCWIRYIFL